MYLISADVLGKVYGVISKRRGRIVGEEMKEGTMYFTVTALLPVVESFGFADGRYILSLSLLGHLYYCRYPQADVWCGKPAAYFQWVSESSRVEQHRRVTAQSSYELLDQDPFWVPTTEEELEDLGEKADRANSAKEYMDTVRERKGMFVDRKIVQFAEKQRTLKR